MDQDPTKCLQSFANFSGATLGTPTRHTAVSGSMSVRAATRFESEGDEIG